MSWVHTSDTFPRARKQYRCRGCYEPIEKGEVHLARRGFDCDGPLTTRWHKECEEYAFIDGGPYDSSPGAFTRVEAKAYISKSVAGIGFAEVSP